MSRITVIALEPFNSHSPGARFELGEVEASQAIARGLVKLDAPLSNKMKVPPLNKANPTVAVGETQPSSASPAARVSPLTTASLSLPGVQNRRGRPPNSAKSSPST